MNSLSFIKSFLTICAAPSLLSNIEVKTGLPKTKDKKSIYFKMPTQAAEDKDYLQYLLYIHCEKGKIDTSKPFAYKIGWDNDDFTKNLLTCVITQYE